MRPGPDRKVVFALLAIAALCVIGVGASLYRGKAAQLSRMNEELERKKQQLATLHDKLADQPKLEEKYASLQARLSVLEPALPNSAYMPTFLRQIEGLAVGTRNRIVMVRPKQEASEGKGKSAAINDETGEIVSNKAPAGASKEATDKPKLPYDRMDIEVKVQGTYWTVIDFLNELRQFPKMIAINDVAFTPERVGISGQSQAGGADVTATLALTAVIAKGGKG